MPYIAVYLSDFDDDDVIEHARKVTEAGFVALTPDDKIFLCGHFLEMSDKARAAGDLVNAGRFDRYRELVRG